MSLDPKILALSEQLGALLKAYVPGEESGHAAVEIYEAFQRGFASDSSPILDLNLPVRRQEAWKFDPAGGLARRKDSFDIAAPHAFAMMIQSHALVVSTGDLDAETVNPTVTIAYNAAGDLVVSMADRCGVEVRELKVP